MTLGINTNLASLNAQRNQTHSQNALSTAIARLSSGLRINSAADDAAGLAIADRFTSQIRGTTQAGRNANDGISLAQTAEGALASIDDNLQRIRELSVQSANATNSASDRASLQLEVSQLQSEIDRVATQTQFNGINLLDGSFTAKQFQVGANVGQTIQVAGVASARSSALGVYQGFDALNTSFTVAAGNFNYAITVTVGGGPAISLGSVPANVRSLAAAINTAAIPGLAASAPPNLGAPPGVSTASASASGTAVLTLNGIAINIAGSTGAAALASNRSAAMTAINAQSAATGVVASDTGSGLRLIAPQGDNITFAYSAGSFTGSSTADFGLPTASTYSWGIDLHYAAPAGVTGNVVFSIGGAFPTYAIGTTGSAISALDVSTVAGANAALPAVDAALATVSSARAALGAVQNRFTSTIGNLQSASKNLAASRSRIQDADFASETADLSRAQVLQAAGTAMIAQANQTPSQVLALLRSG